MILALHTPQIYVKQQIANPSQQFQYDQHELHFHEHVHLSSNPSTFISINFQFTILITQLSNQFHSLSLSQL